MFDQLSGLFKKSLWKGCTFAFHIVVSFFFFFKFKVIFLAIEYLQYLLQYGVVTFT